jgi:ribosome-binding protein aMBF1 (putative translation factor)
MSNLRINPDYATDVLPNDRFDAAIKEAIDRDQEMRVEYERDELAMRFSRIVRQLRDERQVTQHDLAAQVNVPQSFIARLENPTAGKEPSMSTLSKVMGAFGYKVVIGFEKNGRLPEISVDMDRLTDSDVA